MKERTKEIREKRVDMQRESWIKNVMRIYPEKTRQETEELFDKLFNDPSKWKIELKD